MIKCECCNKEISEESINCINCGHPINQYELLFAYEYNGRVINTPLFRDKIEKLKVLKMVEKVEVYNNTYNIVDIIVDAHNEIVHVLLDN